MAILKKKPVRRLVKGLAKMGASAAKQRYGSLHGIATLGRDVAMLKSAINAEKKRISSAVTGTLGQVDINTAGYLCLDITPSIAEGVTYQTRSGSSIKLHSLNLRYQLYAQSASINNHKLKFFLLQVKGPPVSSATTFATQILSANTFVGGASIGDYSSEWNPDYFRQYKIIRRWSDFLKGDTVASQTEIQTRRKGHIFNRGKGLHVRYSQDSTTLTAGQLILLILCDNGNRHPTTVSTLTNISTTAALTGLNYDHNATFYYYDN